MQPWSAITAGAASNCAASACRSTDPHIAQNIHGPCPHPVQVDHEHHPSVHAPARRAKSFAYRRHSRLCAGRLCAGRLIDGYNSQYVQLRVRD
eukprot:4272611-Prymnesium_polylepis.1